MVRVLENVDWRIFSILMVAGLLGVVAVVPYMVDLLGSVAIGERAISEVAMPVLMLALVQNALLLSVVIVIGLLLSERIGLDMPLIRGWATGRPAQEHAVILGKGWLDLTF